MALRMSKGGYKLTERDIENMFKWFTIGYTVTSIGEELGVTRQTVTRYKKKWREEERQKRLKEHGYANGN